MEQRLGGEFRSLIVQAFDDGNFKKGYAFFPKDFFFAGQGRTLDVSFLGFSEVHLQGFLGKVKPYILKVFVNVVIDHLKGCLGVDPIISQIFASIPISFDPKGAEGHFNVVVLANWANDLPVRFLLLISLAVFEPALEAMSVGADQIIGNHDNSRSLPMGPSLFFQPLRIFILAKNFLGLQGNCFSFPLDGSLGPRGKPWVSRTSKKPEGIAKPSSPW